MVYNILGLEVFNYIVQMVLSFHQGFLSYELKKVII